MLALFATGDRFVKYVEGYVYTWHGIRRTDKPFVAGSVCIRLHSSARYTFLDGIGSKRMGVAALFACIDCSIERRCYQRSHSVSDALDARLVL